MSHNTLNTLKEFKISGTKKGKFYSLPALQKKIRYQYRPFASFYPCCA